MRIHAASLVYFDRVCRCGSIREAARQLNISASSVGRALTKLEEEANFPLFERLPDGLRPTAAGERLARHVATVLQDADQTLADLAGLRQSLNGTLKVACSESLNTALMPDLIARMHEKQPGVRISARSGGFRAIYEAVMKGDVDLALLFIPRRIKRMQPLLSWRFRLGAIIPSGHPLAGRTSVTIADCIPFPLILGNDDLTTTPLMSGLLDPWRGKLKIRAEVGSVILMASMIARGLGIGFSSPFGFESALKDQTVVFVPVDAPHAIFTEVAAYARAEQGSPGLLAAFSQILEDEMKQRFTAPGALEDARAR